MAGGKLTPRQKMINLMYLVFIAMLALNMSKEVLTAFGLMNEEFEISNKNSEEKSKNFAADLAQKAKDKPAEYGEAKKQFDQVAAASAKFYTYLESLKADLSSEYERNEAGKLPYENMDKGDKADEWFTGDRYSKKGDEIIAEFASYTNAVKSALSKNKKTADIVKEVEIKFNTNDVTDGEGVTKKYLDYHYKGFPGIASVTKISALQYNIKNIEANTYSALVGASAITTASMSNYAAIVIPEKSAFFAGETFKGKVVLGRYDDSTVPTKVNVNGRDLNLKESLVGGQVNLAFQTGNVGEHEIKGSFTFMEDGKPIDIPIAGNYVVVPKPNSATISADKMNSVYRGVVNPMTISFAGISDDKVTVSAPGLSKGAKNGQYNWNVTSVNGEKAVVTVTGKLQDGTSVSDRKEFVIRDIPRPAASVRGTTGSMKGNKNDLKSSTIRVEFPDFVFDVTARVVSFEIFCPGSPGIVVQGDKLSDAALKAIDKTTRGDQILITNIKTKLVGAEGYTMRPSSAFSWEVQ
ncbi:MAG: gliding motility protein GldM [Flavobacterium sp.]